MKKYFFSSILVFVLSMMVLYLYNNKNNLNLSDLNLNNIEALAQGEIIIETPCMLIWPMPLCQIHADEGIIRFGVPYQ